MVWNNKQLPTCVSLVAEGIALPTVALVTFVGCLSVVTVGESAFFNILNVSTVDNSVYVTSGSLSVM